MGNSGGDGGQLSAASAIQGIAAPIGDPEISPAMGKKGDSVPGVLAVTNH